MKFFNFIISIIILIIALFLPYRLRVVYGNILAFIVHVPFYIFGKLAGILLKKLNLVEINQKNDNVS